MTLDRVRLRHWAVAGPLLLLFGVFGAISCGGSGGSVALTYITDWSNRGRGITGQSQRVTVFDTQQRVLDTVIVNQEVNGVMSVRLDTGSGERHLLVELFSDVNLGGIKTGVIDAWVNVGKGTTFRTAVGLDVTSVRVTPQSATLKVQHSRQFYATGYNGPDVAVFVEPTDAFTWQTLGGTASVNESGLVLGLSEGGGSVRATHNATGIQGSAVFTVLPFTTTTTKWTIMVFLNAANDLYPFSTLNVNQMERVAQNPEVRFVVQWKQSQSRWPQSSFDGTRRYLVKPDTTSAIASELIQDMGSGVDMGRHETLLDFVNWTKTYFPAQRYVLVVWDHGNGWRRAAQESVRAVSYDDETGNAIQVWELAQGLGNNVIDILAWDASLMQMLEVAYEIQDRVRYIAGSEESPPGEGYPYDLVFQRFRDNPDDTTANLSKAFVDGMLNNPLYAGRKITQSVLDPTKLPALGKAVSALGDELIANVASLGTAIPTIRSQAQSYSDSGPRRYRDLVHLCQLMEAQISIPSIQAAAAAVRAAVVDAIVWEGHNSNSPNSNGVSIDFSSAAQFAGASADYALLRFAQETSWNEWLTIAP